MQKTIFLVGTGQMAIEYNKVLKAQEQEFTVIGRGELLAHKFEEETGIIPFIGGIEKFLDTSPFPKNSYVIIATGIQDLMKTLLTVLRAGAYRVLIEKPAALSIEELIANEENINPYGEKVFVAYNRRFYSSVFEVQRLINEDGGLQSMHFEFTEWAHKIEPLQKANGVKENWFFANSTHVVDLAFFLAGKPLDWKTYSKRGKITWHDKTNFSGAGITVNGILFSYISNWESAGRWAIELFTNRRRIYLKPIEGIGIQQKGTISIIDHLFNDIDDKKFKPGLYKQVDCFLNETDFLLHNILNHISDTKEIFSKIVG